MRRKYGHDIFSTVIELTMFLYILTLYFFGQISELVVIPNSFALILIVSILFEVLLKGGTIRINKVLTSFALFVIISLLSFFYALDQTVAFVKSRTLILVFTLMLSLAAYVASLERVKRLMNYYIWSGFFLSIYILRSAVISLLNNSYFSRFGGELGNENAIGISIGLAAVFTFYFIYAERKLAYILPLTVMIPSALLTGSRKVVILFLFNFTLIPSLYYIRFQKIKLRSVLKFIGLSLLIVFLLYYAIFNIPVFYQSIGKRVQALFVFSTGGYVKDYSLVERRYMMDSGLRFFSEKPLVGHGIDNFRALFISVPGGKDTYAHNNFIELLVDVGILGFIFFYLTHFFALQHLSALSKRGSKSVAVMSYVMSSIIISYVILSIAQVYYYDKHFSILLAISSSLCSSEKRK